MSHIRMGHVTHMHESCHTYVVVMSPIAAWADISRSFLRRCSTIVFHTAAGNKIEDGSAAGPVWLGGGSVGG